MESITKPIMQGAIFDMDGTLINSIIYWDIFWKELGERYLHRPNFRPPHDLELQVRTCLFTDVIRILKETYQIEASHREMLDYFNGLLYDFYRDTVEVKDGVIPFLEHLKEQNIPICVASATARDMLELVIKARGLDRYFSTVLTCADLGVGKDRPDIYQLALSTLGTPKETTWVFEDSLLALTTAHHFGLKTVGVYDAGEPRQKELEATADLYIAKGEGMDKLKSLRVV